MIDEFDVMAELGIDREELVDNFLEKLPPNSYRFDMETERYEFDWFRIKNILDTYVPAQYRRPRQLIA